MQDTPKTLFSYGLSTEANEAYTQVLKVAKLLPLVLCCIALRFDEDTDYTGALRRLLEKKSDTSLSPELSERQKTIQTIVDFGKENCPFHGLNLGELIPFPVLQYVVYSLKIKLPPICKINPLYEQFIGVIDAAATLQRQHFAIERLNPQMK